MHSEQAKILNSINLDELLKHILGKTTSYNSIGHEQLERNRVYYLDEFNVVLKLYGEISRWNKEISALSKNYGTSFKTPYLYKFGVYNNIGWVMMSKLEGKILSDLYSNLDSESKSDLWRTLGEKLMSFHRQNIQTISTSDNLYFSDKAFATYYMDIQKKYDYCKNKICNRNYYGQQKIFCTFLNIIEMQLEHYKQNKSVTVTLCHNDFGLRNILQNKNQFSLIDFELSTMSETETDLSSVFLDLDDKAYFSEFLLGYYGVSEQSYEIKQKIKFYLLLKAINVCSWAYERDNDYFQTAFSVLEEMFLEQESI